MLYPEISDCLRNQLESLIDVVISEDRFENTSGIMCYLYKQNIIGTLWWKYISFVLRIFKNWKNNANNMILMGGEFNAEKLMILGRLLLNNKLKEGEKVKSRNLAQKVYLTG